jgi:hypothetical protein
MEVTLKVIGWPVPEMYQIFIYFLQSIPYIFIRVNSKW